MTAKEFEEGVSDNHEETVKHDQTSGFHMLKPSGLIIIIIADQSIPPRIGTKPGFLDVKLLVFCFDT